jgi:hypothetical protein
VGSFSRSKVRPLMVALVPTGIKIGVWIFTPLRVISPTRALPRCLRMVKLSFGCIEECIGIPLKKTTVKIVLCSCSCSFGDLLSLA